MVLMLRLSLDMVSSPMYIGPRLRAVTNLTDGLDIIQRQPIPPTPLHTLRQTPTMLHLVR